MSCPGSFHRLRTHRNYLARKRTVRWLPAAYSHALGIPYGCLMHLVAFAWRFGPDWVRPGYPFVEYYLRGVVPASDSSLQRGGTPQVFYFGTDFPKVAVNPS